MMAAASVIVKSNQTVSSEQILKQVSKFVKGSRRDGAFGDKDLTQSALFLLKNLPSARHAVLQYLGGVFQDAVSASLHSHESGSAHDITSDRLVDDVQTVMMSLIKLNPSAWAPIISAWSIDLLGVVSSRCVQQGRAIPHNTSSLNELLQMWMTCRPSKALVDIASQCFASMIGGSPSVCVDALLEASVKYSPHFDWVVAHIGSCFPKTIITRVLMCGLEDFYLHGSSQAEMPMTSEEKIPKMASVVGILGHLAGHHGRDIKEALLKLFQDSLQPASSAMQLCVVPFILQLASMSAMLLSVVTTNLVDTLKPDIMNRVAAQFAIKHSKKGNHECESLIDLVVHLLSQSEDGACSVLELLIDSACTPIASDDAMETNQLLDPVIQQTCSIIMERLLIDIQRSVHTKSNSNLLEVPLLRTLASHSTALCKQHSSASGIRQQWLARLLTYLAVYSGESSAAIIMCEILLTSTDPQQLQVLVWVQREVEARSSEVLDSALQRILDATRTADAAGLARLLTNLLWLVRSEAQKMAAKKGKIDRRMLGHALHAHLVRVASLLYTQDLNVALTAVEVLDTAGLPAALPAAAAIKLAAAAVCLLFNALHSSDVPLKCRICRVCRRYLQKLSAQPLTQKVILFYLLQTALMQEYSVALGSKMVAGNTADGHKMAAGVLLKANQSQRTGIPGSQLLSVVFHAGVIGRGLRQALPASPFPKDQQMLNRQVFVDTFAACCHDNRPASASPPDGGPEPERTGAMMSRLARSLAVMFIELVSPDIMYNGIPWPEEEFMKVTMERDLLIKKKFEDNPVLWDILQFLATGPGAMCYSSVILRAIVAMLIAFWETSREKATTDCVWHLDASVKAIACMRKGQLIPSPLCDIAEIFPLVSPYEVFLLLQTVWGYVKENPPVPDQREYPRNGGVERYTAVLKSILHNNIGTLGHLYKRFFPSVTKTSGPSV